MKDWAHASPLSYDASALGIAKWAIPGLARTKLLSIPKYMTEFVTKVASLIPTLLPEGEGLVASLSLRERDRG